MSARSNVLIQKHGEGSKSRLLSCQKLLIQKKATSNLFENEDYKIHWDGLIFINGCDAGPESIPVFIEIIEKQGIKRACSYLKGIYFIAVEFKKNGNLYAFIDNSGLYHAFYTADKISNSFLELAASMGYSSTAFDPDAISEFLNFGYFISPATFFQSIRRIQRQDLLFIYGAGYKISKLEKKGTDRWCTQDPLHLKGFGQHFNDLARSLRNCKISLDLTGGADSRLAAALLDHYKLDFETATSGGTPDYPDIVLSKEVSQALHHPWYCTIHSASEFGNDLHEMLTATDGLYDLLYYHRLYQLQIDRKKRGVDTVISGAGGEIFKDYWWLHDFPFYNREKIDVEKFVNLRIMSFTPLDSLLTFDFSASSRSLKARLVDLCAQYKMDTNSQTYDNIFYNLIMSNVAGRILTAHSKYLNCYAPYLDPDVVNIGFNLKRRMRFYNAFHRKELTKINPQVSKMKTTENGVSVSSKVTDIAADIPAYILEKTGRLLKKMNISRRKPSHTLNDPAFYSLVRDSDSLRESIDVLKKAGVLHKKASPGLIADKNLGAIITLGMATAHLDSKIGQIHSK